MAPLADRRRRVCLRALAARRRRAGRRSRAHRRAGERRAAPPTSPRASSPIICRSSSARPFVVENRTGAGGTTGMGYVAKSVEPDGYTILVHSAAFTIQPATFPNLGYDSGKDFAGVTLARHAPLVMVASPEKYKIAEGTGDGGQGQAELGQLRHRRLWRRRASGRRAAPSRRRIRGAADSVPRRARGDQRSARAARRFLLLADARRRAADPRRQAHGAGGVELRSARSRCREVPTTVEAGYPNSDYNFWIGMWVPVKTPRDVVEKLYQETRKVAGYPERAGKADRARQRAGRT